MRFQTKYRNKPDSLDGLHFDSQKEAKRYQELRLLEKGGVISHLVADKKLLRFALVVNGKHICDYEADFMYEENGQRVIEDAKGMKTPLYALKKKLVHACLGIVIQEV